ncbi:MAG: rhodoquinone biosynthesis methyltransferase RquA [Candidatus Thiodiazotropha lotti]|uniref:rhodoquinone biosynthesis methyltransferase RquA n=1 Tax=Candidatus Thiodiazotropha endoloripes TaxID=1818881 RepID=UPI0009F27770|nr:rhodoquinone biosynthesis methyltransferase RquA [Candidatus Thiodiazotropha endoloripes]MCG7900128.1 rhodoquinone biosynthesis methyltransferase RquA [Candidatus Thiodiazotropha weberae]MCG7990897.1 rhodoquinone biosynthesis methyltransferase RquA [Candidatus Thiodiazotropha lotti]MCG7901528.1 rhodoquinone biosynthesis methyltransferase RquA [Candidatus Thiodiazotropha weberae]MCG7913806.1 rhodoquinone biosynthesis methyltransferase RquA [Candidatus Thiodiazotropha weberae]MCG7999239.1 rho
MERSSTVVSGGLTASTNSCEKEIPSYLQKAYWWAYLHPRAVRFFEQQWLINLILWGNFNNLRDAALEKLGHSIEGKTLQIACVYGDFTPRLAQQLTPGAILDVIDVAPVQLDNTRSKIGSNGQVRLHQQDSSKMEFQDGEFDNTVVFFLLHEQPEAVRLATIAEAVRVTRKGGRIVFVDYHLPAVWNPMRYVMKGIFKLLEPYAENFWCKDIENWANLDRNQAGIKKRLFFGGLYQMTSIDLNAG